MTQTEDDYTLAHAIGPPLCRIWLLIGPPSPLPGIHCLSHMLVFRFSAFLSWTSSIGSCSEPHRNTMTQRTLFGWFSEPILLWVLRGRRRESPVRVAALASQHGGHQSTLSRQQSHQWFIQKLNKIDGLEIKEFTLKVFLFFSFEKPPEKD